MCISFFAQCGAYIITKQQKFCGEAAVYWNFTQKSVGEINILKKNHAKHFHYRTCDESTSSYSLCTSQIWYYTSSALGVPPPPTLPVQVVKLLVCWSTLQTLCRWARKHLLPTRRWRTLVQEVGLLWDYAQIILIFLCVGGGTFAWCFVVFLFFLFPGEAMLRPTKKTVRVYGLPLGWIGCYSLW